MAKQPPRKRQRSIAIVPGATALTISGSDPSGGAGQQADLKVFQQLAVYGMSVLTLVTVQNTQGVSQVQVLSPDLIEAQIDAVLADIPPNVIKVGALGTAEVVRAVSQRLQDVECPIVVDPVLVSKHGHSLAEDDVVQAYRDHLLPLAWMVTPNLREAERLTGLTIDSDLTESQAVHELLQFGARHVFIKLGARDGKSLHLLSGEEHNTILALPRLDANNTHGAGCVLSAAIAATLALGETDAQAAADFGMQCAFHAIHLNTELGQGIHPVEVRGIPRNE